MVFYIHEGLNVEVFIETDMDINSEENIVSQLDVKMFKFHNKI